MKFSLFFAIEIEAEPKSLKKHSLKTNFYILGKPNLSNLTLFCEMCKFHMVITII